MNSSSVPRWMRGVAAVTTAAFAWSMILAAPVSALAHAKQAFNPLVRKLSDAEMQKMVGGQTVPQAGNGQSDPHTAQAYSSPTWKITTAGGSFIADSTTTNGWSMSVAGSRFNLSAPGSAGLGSYKGYYAYGGGRVATFDVIEPATSLRSGGAYSWEGLGGGNERVRDQAPPRPAVNYVNGNKTTAVPIVGWTARGGLPVNFTLVHNSQSANNLTLGVKWTHSYDLYLLVDGSGNVTTHFGDDTSYQFTKNIGGSYTAPAGIYDTLVKNVSGTYTLTTQHQVVYQFNTSLRCTSITDRNGNALTLAYSGNNVITVTDPSSRVLTLGYTSGKITSVTDPLSRTWTIDYDGSGRVYKVKLPLLSGQSVNSFTQLGYDSRNNITTLTTPRGKSWTFSYFPSSDTLQWEKDPLLNATSYAYTTTDKTMTDPNGNVTTLTYNTNGELSKVTDPLTKHTDFTYDSSHNRLTVLDKRGYTNTLTYDTSGNALTVTNPYSKVWTYTYTAKNDVATVTDPLSHVTTSTYDTAGNLTKVTDALSNVTDYVVNGYGLTTDVKTYPVGGTTLTTTYAYDSNGHLTSITDPLSHATTYTVDGIGRTTAVTDALTHSSSVTLDNWGRTLTATTPAGTTSYYYDDDSNLTKITDANSHDTTFTYDDAERLLTKTLANGDVMTYAYDATGKKGLLSSQTDGNGRATSFTYTSRNQLASATYPVSSGVNTSESWTYNDAGQLASRTDCNSVTTNYAYSI